MKIRDTPGAPTRTLNGAIDWDTVARQLLRALRGKRSQLALSRRLGYRGRPVADWEAGRRFPTAAILLRVCKTTGVDVAGAFARFHAPSVAALGDGDDTGVAQWMNELRAGRPMIDLARQSGEPRFSVSRWLSGQNRPRVPQFLRMVEALTGRASDLIAELVDISLVPALADAHHRHLAAKSLAFDEPWTAAILRVLETAKYGGLPAHSPGWIAGVLGIDFEVEARCLEKLRVAGMISVDAATGKYVCLPATIDTHAPPAELARLKAHWTRVAEQRIEDRNPADLFSFNLISVSTEDLDRIRQLLRATYREIRGIVAASAPVEQVALVQLQLATWSP